jgi:glycosyltransferase involved in cell wall biosynthesis
VASTAPIRILRIIARMNVGGPAIQISELMVNLPPSLFEQRLVTGYCSDHELDYLEVNNVEVASYKLSGFGRRLNLIADLRVLFAIKSQIKDFKPTVIHTHTSKAGFLGRLASLMTGKKCILVHTFHGHLLHGYFSWGKTTLLILAERFLAHYTDALISVGQQVMQELLQAKIGNREKFFVIGPGLKVKNLPPRDLVKNKLGIPKEKFIVTWLGRVVEIKAPERILEIALECKLRGLDVHFVICGDGPILEELKSKSVELNIPIQFLGWQTEIEPILSFSDLVLLTSENEGMPVSLIQAQMAGIPVLTTDVGSASEVMINEESGFCLKYSAKDFVDKIEILIGNPEMQKLFGKVGRSNALEKFSHSRLVSDHLKLYTTLTSQSNS